MKKYVFVLFLSMLTAGCSTVTQKETAPSIRESVKSTQQVQPVAKPVKPKSLYSATVQKYIDNNSAVQQLREVAPTHAKKVFEGNQKDCTLEKFVSGVNGTSAKIVKNGNKISIYTYGAKLGDGIIDVDVSQSTPVVLSASIGKIKQTDSEVLAGMTQKICTSAEEKAKN